MDNFEAYERNYKGYQSLVTPQIHAIKTEIDIFPIQQTCQIRAEYQLVNPGNTPISEIFVTSAKPLQKITVANARLTLQDSDEQWHVYLFKLNTPLLPGDTRVMCYHLQHASQPLSLDNSCVCNGTYFNQQDFEPRLGYIDDLQISDPDERQKRGLEACKSDKNGKDNNPTAHCHHFETVISTSRGQTAITSGQLLKRWERQGRSYFHYQMLQTNGSLISYFSAHYRQGMLNHKGMPLQLYFHTVNGYAPGPLKPVGQRKKTLMQLISAGQALLNTSLTRLMRALK